MQLHVATNDKLTDDEERGKSWRFWTATPSRSSSFGRGIILFGQKVPYSTNNVSFSVNKAMVVRVGEREDLSVWNRFAKEIDLLRFHLATLP